MQEEAVHDEQEVSNKDTQATKAVVTYGVKQEGLRQKPCDDVVVKEGALEESTLKDDDDDLLNAAIVQAEADRLEWDSKAIQAWRIVEAIVRRREPRCCCNKALEATALKCEQACEVECMRCQRMGTEVFAMALCPNEACEFALCARCCTTWEITSQWLAER